MIQYQKQFEKHIRAKGVGKNDKVSDSVKSYISYLNSVAKHLAIEISPSTLKNKMDIDTLCLKLNSHVSKKTVKNYQTAMNHYVEMLDNSQLRKE